MKLALAMMVGVVLACGGCSEDSMECTTELRTAVIVHVTGETSRVTGVQAHYGDQVEDCNGGGDGDAGDGELTYGCSEIGAGEYVIEVMTDDLGASASVDVAADGCHVAYQPAEVEIEVP